MSSPCATAAQLEGLLKGTLAPAESAALDEHLAECAACRRQLNALAGDNESWLQAKENSPAEAVDSPPLRKAMNRLKGAELIPPSEKSGDRIGRYKLLQQIGEGGCGVVYMAEQEEPVRRRVALKIIKLGMDTKSVIARFEGERQALALMDHPNIAKVFDAGTTETGRPYFVMELVRGVKITEYCDEAKLSTRARLDLFIQVCQAIQHAHQKGIIHRDIKPSNILVTVNDGVPVPKVIDFGIAKATSGQQLTDKTLFTAFEQFIGTPAYMSPEQAVMTSLDIDTRSDIYALGVLLYELLTGRTPFDPKELLTLGLDEMRRTICEAEPARPSTCVSTLPDQELSTTAQRRGLEAPKLVSELRGDLDWIVMKCLEKDRARRYETANGVSADIQRHLNNEPVVACPPSRVYRLQKTVRRNRLAFAAAAAVAVALVLGMVASMWQAARARRAEQAAKEEKDSAKAVLKFFEEKILAADRPEGEDGGLGKDVTLRKTVDAAESEIAKAFQDRPLVEADVRETLGITYSALGETALAIQQAERVLALRRKHLGPEHPDTLKVMASLGKKYVRVGKYEQGLPLLEKALEERKHRWGLANSNTIDVEEDLGRALLDAGKKDQSIALLNEALRVSKASLGAAHSQTLNIMKELGNAYRLTGKSNETFAVLKQALELSETKLGPEAAQTLFLMNDLGNAYSDFGKADEAISLLNKVVESHQAKLGPGNHETLVALHNLGVAFSRAGKPERAVPVLETAFELSATNFGRLHLRTMDTMFALSYVYWDTGKLDKALPLLEDLLERRTEALGRDEPRTLTVMNELGFGYLRASKFHKAITFLEEAVKLRERKLGPDHDDTLASMDNLSRAYAGAGQLDQAVTLLKKIQSRQRPNNPGTLNLMSYITQKYARAGKLDQGLSLFQETLKLAKANLGSNPREALAAMNALAIACADAHKLDQAISLWEEILNLAKTKLGQESPATLQYTANLAHAYRETGKLDQLESMYREQLPQLHSNGLSVRLELGRLLLETAHTNQTPRGKKRVSEGVQLLREYLAGARSRYTNDPLKLASKLYDVADMFYRQANYSEAEPLYREIVELRGSRLKADDKEVLDAKASLARVLSDWAWAERTNIVAAEVTRLTSSSQPATTNSPTTDQSLVTSAATSPYERAREAERFLHEVLAVRLRESTNSWHIGELQSRLGGALVSVAVTDPTLDAPGREAKFREAESLLLDGGERLGKSSIDPKYLRDARERLDRLYEAWGKPDKISEWNQKDHADTLAGTALRLLQQEKFAEAETSARDCLAIREKEMPDDWRTFNARSMLGGSLLGQKKYAAAEPLLLAGYEGMKQRENTIPSQGKLRIRETLQRLVQLYEVTGRDAEVAGWKQKLAEFDQPITAKTPAETKVETK